MDKPSNDIERLEKLLVEARMSWAELARRIGVSDQAVGNWKMRGRVPPGKATVLASALQSTADYILSGRMGPQTAQGGNDGKWDHPTSFRAAPSFPSRQFPVLSWLTAGSWPETSPGFAPVDVAEWFPCPVMCSAATYVLRVEGVSMEPRFRPGELIFVDPDVHAKHNSFVIVQFPGEPAVSLKQLVIEGSRGYLRSLNDRWPEPVVEVADGIAICGVVVFKGEPI